MLATSANPAMPVRRKEEGGEAELDVQDGQGRSEQRQRRGNTLAASARCARRRVFVVRV